ncbi:uncharacterized protein LODBEIA_P31850 [Lodderomyces beijingensis]|uniref:CNH domain-containing protein n=1 Tax=Lodderomyces beijingensis TaxID=1775926 RepID=A0ABP0ZPB0_9ASCO
MLRLGQQQIFLVEIILSLVFVVSVILIGITLKARQRAQSDELVEHERFNSIELKNNRPSDILKVCTNSKCAIVVTFELNHIITAWSPVDKRKHILSKDSWPIQHIAVSDDGIYIILVNFNKGRVYCFENFKFKWVESIPKITRDTKILESFFRVRTVPGYLTRKMMKRSSSSSLSSLSSHINGNFPPPAPQPAPHPASPLPNPFSQQSQIVEPSVKEDFVMVLKTELIIISCSDGAVKSEPLQPLTAAAKITTPRVNDKIVFRDEQGTLTVGVAVNNKFIFRNLPIKDVYIGNRMASAVAAAPVSAHRNRNLNPPTMVAVNFIGMIVLVQDLNAHLIDVSTGVLLRTFNIGHFKAGTFKVAHSEPTHCKFCGCVSVHSFSLIYQEEDTNMVIVHTFKIDNSRSKNSICLRVERDPREIRCLGFNSVSESQYWYENIKCWQASDVNTIIGLEKLPPPMSSPNTTTTTTTRTTDCLDNYGRLTSLRQRKKKSPAVKKDKYEGFIISLVDGKKETYPINIESPICSSAKYGFKSILINFGDSMKIFYQGTNKLIENELYYNPATNGANSLLFISKRRNRL